MESQGYDSDQNSQYIQKAQNIFLRTIFYYGLNKLNKIELNK